MEPVEEREGAAVAESSPHSTAADRLMASRLRAVGSMFFLGACFPLHLADGQQPLLPLAGLVGAWSILRFSSAAGDDEMRRELRGVVALTVLIAGFSALTFVPGRRWHDLVLPTYVLEVLGMAWWARSVGAWATRRAWAKTAARYRRSAIAASAAAGALVLFAVGVISFVKPGGRVKQGFSPRLLLDRSLTAGSIQLALLVPLAFGAYATWQLAVAALDLRDDLLPEQRSSGVLVGLVRRRMTAARRRVEAGQARRSVS